MAKFDPALTRLLVDEGGWSDDPDDSGGQTWEGISRENWPDWEGWSIIDSLRGGPDFPDCLNSNPDLPAKVSAFYKAHFWNPAYELWTQELANRVFSMAVNAGSSVAIRCLQRASRAAGNSVEDDGTLGTRTQHAVLSCEPGELLAAYRSECAAFYRMTALSHPTNQKFLEGWLNRAYR